MLRTGYFHKHRDPADWLRFRHAVDKECALRNEPAGGPPKRNVEEVITGLNNRHCKLLHLRPSVYSLSWEELCTVSQLVATLAPARIFEFGTFDGRTTIHLALNAPEHALVYSIDTQSGEFDFATDSNFHSRCRVGHFTLGTDAGKKVRMLTGDSKEYDFACFMNTMDFVFIDADHSYEGVISDSRVAFDLVRPGGMIVWHDYLVIDDVSKAIIEINTTKSLVNLRGTSLVIWRRPEGGDRSNGTGLALDP